MDRDTEISAYKIYRRSTLMFYIIIKFFMENIHLLNFWKQPSDLE